MEHPNMEPKSAAGGMPAMRKIAPEQYMPTVELRDITPENVRRYGYQKLQIISNGHPTRRTLIYKDGDFIEAQGLTYKIVPHEVVAELATEVARGMGLKPFTGLISGGGFVEADFADGALLNRAGTHMFQFFGYKDDAVVDGDDEICHGLFVQNSIDGKFKFGAGAWTFRYACSNMVYVNRVRRTIENERGFKAVGIPHSERAIVDFDVLRGAITKSAAYVRSLKHGYDRLAAIDLNDEIAARIRQRVPQKDIRDVIYKDENGAWQHEKVNLWNAYNTITEQIWHDEKNALSTKQEKFNNHHVALATVAGW